MSLVIDTSVHNKRLELLIYCSQFLSICDEVKNKLRTKLSGQVKIENECHLIRIELKL